MRTFRIQRWSAIALLFFMTLHMIVVHYPPFHINFNNILVRLQSPTWKIIDILFLFSVLVHAMAGSYQVITDFEGAFNYRKGIAWASIIIVIVAFIYGAKTIWAFQPPV